MVDLLLTGNLMDMVDTNKKRLAYPDLDISKVVTVL